MSLHKCKLGELITQRREKNNDDSLPISGVSKDGLIPPKQQEADTSLYNMFYRGDFIFNPARMELNSIAYNDKYDKAICSSLYEVFYVHRTDLIMPEFLALIVKQDWFTRYCEFLGQGSAREYCRFANISEIEIEFPDIDVQKKTVHSYNVIKRRIELKQRINDNLASTGIAIIEKFIGNPAQINKTQADLDSIVLPDGWKLLSISQFCKETKSGATPSRDIAEYWINGNIPWVKSGEVHNGIILKVEEHITQNAIDNSSTKLLPSDTVLMAMYGVTAGEVGYLAIPATTNQAVCGMVCKSKAEAAYLFFSLLQSKEQASRLSNGGAQDNLSKGFIDNIVLIVPSYHEIEKLELNKIINSILLNSKEILMLLEMQNSLLTQLSSS